MNYHDAVIADAPLAYWRFADIPSDGGVLTDEMILRPGTFHGTGITTTEGAVLENNVMRNPGVFLYAPTHSYISVPYASDYNPTQATNFGFEIWFKSNSETSVGYLVSSWDNALSKGWKVSINGSNIQIDLTGFTAYTQFTIGEWHHFGWNSNGATVGFFLDGVPFSSTASSSLEPHNTTADLLFGVSNIAVPTSFASVHVDEAAFYPRTLIGDELLEHYQAALSLTDFIDPEVSWLESTIVSLEKYLLEKNNGYYDVKTSFPAANEDLSFPMTKTVIHMEVDDIQNLSTGFGDGTNIWNIDYDDVNKVMYPNEAGWHELNIDIGVWASHDSGGATARLRAYQFLTDAFYGARARNKLLESGIQILYFRGGSFVRDTISEQDVFRVSGMELGLRVFSRKTTPLDEAVPYIEQIDQSPNLT